MITSLSAKNSNKNKLLKIKQLEQYSFYSYFDWQISNCWLMDKLYTTSSNWILNRSNFGSITLLSMICHCFLAYCERQRYNQQFITFYELFVYYICNTFMKQKLTISKCLNNLSTSIETLKYNLNHRILWRIKQWKLLGFRLKSIPMWHQVLQLYIIIDQYLW